MKWMLPDFSELAVSSPRNKYMVGLWFRVICAAVFLLFVGAIDVAQVLGEPRIRLYTYGALCCLIGLNYVYWYLGRSTGFGLAHFYAHWMLDLILIVGVLSGLGDWSVAVAMSSLTLIIVTSATFISMFASLVVAGGASVAVLSWSLIMAGTQGVAQSEVEWTGSKVLFVTGSGTVFFFMIAFLAGTLAEALKRTNAMLEGRNAELASSNVALRELQAEIEFQTRVVAHDIRGPVAAAAGAIAVARSLVSEGSTADDVREGRDMLNEAIESLGRADRMIARLRELQEAEGAAFQEAAVSIEELLKELEAEWRSAMSERRVTLNVACAGVVVQGDRALLEVIFRNLVSNALKYVPDDGTGTIQVSLRTMNDRLLFTVEDNGCGIPDSLRGEAFRMFRRLRDGNPSKGLGIGLGLVRRAVERHQGRVWIERSELGGAAVSFEFPKERVARRG